MRVSTGIIFTALCLCAVSASAAVWYVDAGNESGTEDGTSWATAFTEIQAGIDAASGDGGGEVWVAAGTYDELRNSEFDAAGVNSGCLELLGGVALYGGFDGTESARAARDWEANVTWIDGSTARDGAAAYHVVAGVSNTVIDGFSITGGASKKTDASLTWVGAGLCLEAYPLTNVSVANCTFVGNGVLDQDPYESTNQAGALLVTSQATDVFVTDCAFSDNEAQYGGAVKCGVGVTFERCSFLGNRALYRGGVLNGGATGTVFQSCLFADNEAGTDGGAMYSNGSGEMTVENCVFIRNSSGGDGGAMLAYDQRYIVVNCTFLDNTAVGNGQAAYFYYTYGRKRFDNSSCVVFNSILWGTADNQLVVSISDAMYDPVLVSHSNVHGISGYSYTGIDNIDEDPRFLDAGSDDLQLAPDSPCIDTGASEEAPSTDITGRARPQGEGIDMGAYEYAGAFLIEASRPGPFEEGDELTLSVIASGTLGATAYAWYKDGVALAGEDSDILQFDSLTEVHSGWYWCEVTDDSKAITSTPHVLIQVYPEGALPASGALGLAMAAVGSALAALRALRTRRRQG